MRITAPASIRIAAVGLTCAAIALLGQNVVLACTAFCASGGGQVLVGNNEDWHNPRTKIWFVTAKAGSYGRVYVGFDDLYPQGGMNERGLWFDGFAAPAVKAAGSSNLPHFGGNIIDHAMATCATVDEVVRLFGQYNRAFLTEGILMFADASGDAVSIEPDAMVRKSREHFVQTNFHQSRSRSGAGDRRFATASAMLERAGQEISVDLFRRILAATHQNGISPTLYSNVYDLRSRTMHLYYFHDFEHAVTFDLAEELKKGARVLDIPALFPRNAAAEDFAARRKTQDGPSEPAITVAAAAFLCVILAAAVYGWRHAGRGFRIGLSVLVAAVAVAVVLTGVVLNTHRQTSAPWIEFSIGPASGQSSSINATAMRSNGISLKVALAVAHDIPAVRIIGPSWLTDTRYSITAVVGLEAADSFRSMLQEELNHRLRLETHVEFRPFDVFVLTATDAPRLERSSGQDPRTRIDEREAQLQDASMERLASALQSILGKPVIDETGITGSYNLEFGWGDDRAASVTTVLRDRFALMLSPNRRDMEALIVDQVRRDAALHLLAQVGRATRGAPPNLRQQIARILTIH